MGKKTESSVPIFENHNWFNFLNLILLIRTLEFWISEIFRFTRLSWQFFLLKAKSAFNVAEFVCVRACKCVSYVWIWSKRRSVAEESLTCQNNPFQAAYCSSVSQKKSFVQLQLLTRVKMEQLQSSLSLVKLLRTSVAQVFETLGNGISIENGNENQFQQELHEILTSANTRLRYVPHYVELNQIINCNVFQRIQ